MKLEEQVASLELAKRLKELGVKQDSWFKWEKTIEEVKEEYQLDYHGVEHEGNIAAFSVAELGEMLPELYGTIKRDGNWSGMGIDEYNWAEWVDDKSEADARAKLLIHLIEEKIITIE